MAKKRGQSKRKGAGLLLAGAAVLGLVALASQKPTPPPPPPPPPGGGLDFNITIV